MKYNEDTIDRLYNKSLAKAQQLLSLLPVAERRNPNVKGLNGWVYEQTIHHCLLEELAKLGQFPTIEEQVSLGGRAKIDLLVNNTIAIEVKVAGSFGESDEKYSFYRVKAEEKGWTYCYITRTEVHKPYRLITTSVFGNEYAFFLDIKGDWQRFVKVIVNKLRGE